MNEGEKKIGKNKKKKKKRRAKKKNQETKIVTYMEKKTQK